MTLQDLTQLAIKKAQQSPCDNKVAAIGMNRRGEVIYKAFNLGRFERRGGGIHAEMRVMLKAGPSLKSIIVCRTNNAGDLLPIDPCPTCQQKADELGVKLYSLNA